MEAWSGMWEYPSIDTHLIKSKHVEQTFRIQVMQPGRHDGEQKQLPVVYATDGNWTFDMFKSISYLLQMSALDAPPYILVGVGYPSDAPHAGSVLRVRDFTAPPYPYYSPEEVWAAIKTDNCTIHEGTLLPTEGSKVFHGGEDFRNFFEYELIPFVEASYATLPEERIYFGHSGGGFFGLYTLFTRPDLFRSYIVSSPGLVFDGPWHEDGPVLRSAFGLEMAEEFAASGRSLDGKRLYLGAGGEEEYDPLIGGWQNVSGLFRMSRLLRHAAIPGLNLMTEVIPGEGHNSVWPITFTHGVQAMLGTRRIEQVVY